eukprot:Sdes_comp9985_c0_seq1m1552
MEKTTSQSAYQDKENNTVVMPSLPARRFPGPAGILPPLVNGKIPKEAASFLSFDSPNNSSHFKTHMTHDREIFTSGSWTAMLNHYRLPPYDYQSNLVSLSRHDFLKFNIKYVLAEGFLTKIPRLLVYVS